MITILTGDAIEQLRTLPDESVQCCVTSPPYWGLRDYGTAAWEGGEAGCSHEPPQECIDHNFNANSAFGTGAATQSAAAKGRWFKPDGSCRCGARRIDSQLGLERTPEEYVAKMVEVFREVRRVLRKDGTLWLNLGDSYAGSGKGAWDRDDIQKEVYVPGVNGNKIKSEWPGLKPKDLCGIPWRVAFALQTDGWWLRSDIIWAKPNPMPESVTDRPTKAHEYLFLLTKSANYFYDAEAIKEECTDEEYRTVGHFRPDPSGRPGNGKGFEIRGGLHVAQPKTTRNKRSVWTINSHPYPEAHFATYPPDLIKPCIMAGTSAKGCCAKCGAPWERITYGHRAACKCRTESPLSIYTPDYPINPCTVIDPFAGSGTTGSVALELGRKSVLIELNPKYVNLIRQRCDITPGLALA